MTPIEQSHHKFLALVTSARLRPVPLRPTPEDFVLRATTVTLVCSATKEYLTRIVQECAENCAHIDADELTHIIDAFLADLSGDVAGAFTAAAGRLDDDRKQSPASAIITPIRLR